jgi:hypothetical protein
MCFISGEQERETLHFPKCIALMALYRRFGGDGSEQKISRILYLHGLVTKQAAIIYLGRQLPGTSSDQPEG